MHLHLHLHTPLITSTGPAVTRRGAKELLGTPELEMSWCLCLCLYFVPERARERVPGATLEGHTAQLAGGSFFDRSPGPCNRRAAPRPESPLISPRPGCCCQTSRPPRLSRGSWPPRIPSVDEPAASTGGTRAVLLHAESHSSTLTEQCAAATRRWSPSAPHWALVLTSAPLDTKGSLARAGATAAASPKPPLAARGRQFLLLNCFGLAA